jgi:hypothetical protein
MDASAGQGHGLLIERLQGIEAKLDRAAEHLEMVQELGHAWISSDESWDFSSEVAEEKRRYIVSMRLVRPVPASVLLAVDEAVHHLRSSLDHLAGYLVEWSGGQVGRAEWPFARSRFHWQRQVERRVSRWQIWRRTGGAPLSGASPAVRKFVEGRQAFAVSGASAGASLAELDRLWNVSKHRIVNPVEVTAAPDGEWGELFAVSPEIAPVEFRWLLRERDRFLPGVDRRLAILVFPMDGPLPGTGSERRDPGRRLHRRRQGPGPAPRGRPGPDPGDRLRGGRALSARTEERRWG